MTKLIRAGLGRRDVLKAGAGLAAAGLAGPLAAPALAQPKTEKVVLLLNWYLYGEHAPFFIGKEQGLFAEEGIDLDIQEGRGSAVTVQAVAAKTVPFGYADVTTMIRAAAKGAPVVSPGVALQKCPMSVISFAEKNIRKPEDLKGKTIATTPGDALSQIWPLFLRKTGLSESEMKIVSGDATTKLNAVINGQADGLLGFVMDQTMRIKDATGKPVSALMFADYGFNIVASGIIAHQDTLKENADLVRRFMRAATRSIEAAEKNPAGAAEAMLKANPKAGVRETLIEGFQLTAGLYRTAETAKERPFNVTDANMKETVDLMVEYGGLDAAAKEKVKSFYTRDFLPKA
jgi:NitT/TauT family transport system substrate-binding protein